MPSARPSTVFVDTSAYIALARLDDERHNEAVIILNALQRQRVRLCTTNFVVAETHAMMLRYLGRAVAWRFVQELDKSRVTTTARVELADEAGARVILGRYADKDYSLTDALSFSVMGRLGITHAFAFDKHFAQYGIMILPTSPG